jgi:hypothetical protein
MFESALEFLQNLEIGDWIAIILVACIIVANACAFIYTRRLNRQEVMEFEEFRRKNQETMEKRRRARVHRQSAQI